MLGIIDKHRHRITISRGAVDQYGVTLLLTTHNLPDVERLCRRLVVIDHGQVLVDGSLDELRRRFGGARRLVVDLEQPAAALTGLPGVLDVTVEANGLRQQLAFSAEHTSATELITAVAARVPVRDLQVVEPSIEDVVRTLYTA